VEIFTPAEPPLGPFWHIEPALNRRQIAGCATAAAPTTANPSVGQLRALPLIAAGGVLDRLEFIVTVAGAAGARARLGIYANTSRTNLRPAALLVEGTDHATDVIGVKSTTINLAVVRGQLYWIAWNIGVASPQVRALNISQAIPIMGGDTGFSPNFYFGWEWATAPCRTRSRRRLSRCTALPRW